MKEIGRCSDVADDHVSITACLQKTFRSCTRMFRSLSFISMRKEHNQSGHSVPFAFSSTYVLIHDGLSAIKEVAKLCFPQYKMIRTCQRISIFKSKHTKFRQQ